MLLTFLQVLANPIAYPEPEPESDTNVFMGYTTNWDFDTTKIPEYLTHIMHAFAKISEDGTVSPDAKDIGKPDGCKIDGYYAQLNEIKRKQGSKISLSIGGWTYREQFKPVLTDEKKRRVFVVSAIELMLDGGFDGIDLDWEYPQDLTEGQVYVDTLKDLREALDKKGTYLLTSAIPISVDTLTNFKLMEAKEYVDWFNVMNYDGANGETASPFSAVYPGPSTRTKVANFRDALKYMQGLGVENSKIVLGIPLYGKSYNIAKDLDSDKIIDAKLLDNKPTDLTHSEIVDLTNKGGYEKYEDEPTRSVYLYNKAEGKFVTFDDKSTAENKAQLVHNEGLRGVFFWELGQDTVQEDGVIATARGTFSRSVFQRNIDFVKKTPETCTSGTGKYCNIC
eukprot:NODE_558_length_6080_cov_0.296773.p1 type:complete len:394 gc:universal NODE_558_length_6080_cov_0.296773:3539-4720(+)